MLTKASRPLAKARPRWRQQLLNINEFSCLDKLPFLMQVEVERLHLHLTDSRSFPCTNKTNQTETNRRPKKHQFGNI